MSGVADIKVAKPGRGGKALSKKSPKVCRFVAERLSFDYIPAVRTADSARNIVAELVAKELRTVELDPEYQKALDKVAELQQPYLDRISASVKDTLVKFLPDLKGVALRTVKALRYRAARNAYEIIIDDGTPTALEHKGDGVQSLAALGIMRHASESRSESDNLFIALEEPESHLHPEAIHALRDVVEEMSSRHQVILTTHCPLFVNRRAVSSNILVRNNSAKPAKSIDEIRKVLGVRASDNLRNAELVLMVEGPSDERIVRALLPHVSSALGGAVGEARLALETLGGSGNLSYKGSLVRNALCGLHALLDDDDAGRRAFGNAEATGVISATETHFTTSPGMKEAEIEDLIDPVLYADSIKTAFGVTLAGSEFRSKKKWSDRMSAAFKAHGKRWDKTATNRAKELVAMAVEQRPDEALNRHKRGSFDSFVAALEERLLPGTF